MMARNFVKVDLTLAEYYSKDTKCFRPFEFGFDIMNRNIDIAMILIIAEKLKLP